MHRTNVVGISWRRARATALQEYTLPREQRAARLPALANALDATELVYLATCNRVEVIFVARERGAMAEQRSRIITALRGPHDATPRDATLHVTTPHEARAWRAWQGEAAAEHIFLTAAGLDSAMLGEHEVAGQVRDAVEESRALGLVGASLGPVFTGAMRAARRVRPIVENNNSSDELSLADLVVRHVLDRLEAAPGRVALVGVSAMTERCARRLAARGVPLLIVNRTLERAETLARMVGGEASGLDAFREAPEAVEAIVLATGAREPVLSRAHLERIAARSRTGRTPLVVDLGVPPNVAPADATAADVDRIGMEQLTAEATTRRTRRHTGLTEARVAVDDELKELRRATSERLVGAMIAQLQLRYRQTALEGVERLFAHELAGIGDAERERVRRWAETLAHRFAHAPSLGLRSLVYELGPGAVETFFQSTEPELVRAMLETAGQARLDLIDGAEALT